MLALIVTAKVKPAERERFLSVIEDDAISSVRDEPGCVRFEVLQDRDDQDTYYFFEVYKDQGKRQVGTTLDNGSVFRIVEFAPNSTPRVHRTDSVDYAVVMSGEIDM